MVRYQRRIRVEPGIAVAVILVELVESDHVFEDGRPRVVELDEILEPLSPRCQAGPHFLFERCTDRDIDMPREEEGGWILEGRLEL